MTNEEKEKNRRNAHFGTSGYVFIGLIFMLIGILLAKHVSFVLGLLPIFWVFLKIPTLLSIWQRAEEIDTERKKDRIW